MSRHPLLSDRIYPVPAFNEAERSANEAALRATEVAQPAIGGVSLGLFRVLDHFGVRPDLVGGHSFGELTARFPLRGDSILWRSPGWPASVAG